MIFAHVGCLVCISLCFVRSLVDTIFVLYYDVFRCITKYFILYPTVMYVFYFVFL